MPGLGDSRHIPVPTFGYAVPSASAGKRPPVPSGAKPPSAPAPKPAPSWPAAKPLNRAEIAGKAAAKRMNGLQSNSNTFNKPFLYQNYGYPAPQPNLPARPTTTPSAPPPPPFNSRPTAETAEKKRARLHKLFNIWVPRADEFYNTYATLDLTAEEVKAIQDEIVNYRVNSAMAAGNRIRYKASWETATVYLPPQRQVEGGAMNDDTEDLLGLGIPTARVAIDKRGTAGRMDLLD